MNSDEQNQKARDDIEKVFNWLGSEPKIPADIQRILTGWMSQKANEVAMNERLSGSLDNVRSIFQQALARAAKID